MKEKKDYIYIYNIYTYGKAIKVSQPNKKEIHRYFSDEF